MSYRFLYRRLPDDQRICSYYRCSKPILRNITRDKEGRLYHYGCLQTALDEVYRCTRCQAVFNATEASLDEKQRLVGDSVKELLLLQCPFCGSQDLRPATRHHAMPSGQLVNCF